MTIDYADLLSGDPIYLDGVGHFRSPYLYELKPASGIGWLRYSLYLNVFSWDKTQVLKAAKMFQAKGLKVFDGKDALNNFDILIIIPQTKTLLQDALSFFTTEQVQWNEPKRCFSIYDNQNSLVGEINRNNFKDVCYVVNQLNYIRQEESEKELTFQSENAKEMWEKVQTFKQKENKKDSDKQENYSLGNIISKLCCIHSTYNLLNVYDLTVYQLYDQFSQCCYLRGIDLEERVYSIHGGKDFSFNDWLKVVNNKKEGE